MFTYDRPNGNDYNAVTPLFRRMTQTIVDEDVCQGCLQQKDPRFDFYSKEYEPCTCREEKRIDFTQVLVSVLGDAGNSKPGEAVYICRVITGKSTTINITEDMLNTEEYVIEFSISDCLNTSEPNDHYQYVKKYLTIAENEQVFSLFHGCKEARSYVLAFDTIVQKILAVPPSSSTSEVEKKPNPHVGRKQKKKA
jgi:hypothetical protein